MSIEEIEARERAATVTELLPHIRGEELKRMHRYDAYYFARELNEAREKLEAVEAYYARTHDPYLGRILKGGE